MSEVQKLILESTYPAVNINAGAPVGSQEVSVISDYNLFKKFVNATGAGGTSFGNVFEDICIDHIFPMLGIQGASQLNDNALGFGDATPFADIEVDVPGDPGAKVLVSVKCTTTPPDANVLEKADNTMSNKTPKIKIKNFHGGDKGRHIGIAYLDKNPDVNKVYPALMSGTISLAACTAIGNSGLCFRIQYTDPVSGKNAQYLEPIRTGSEVTSVQYNDGRGNKQTASQWQSSKFPKLTSNNNQQAEMAAIPGSVDNAASFQQKFLRGAGKLRTQWVVLTGYDIQKFNSRLEHVESGGRQLVSEIERDVLSVLETNVAGAVISQSTAHTSLTGMFNPGDIPAKDLTKRDQYIMRRRGHLPGQGAALDTAYEQEGRLHQQEIVADIRSKVDDNVEALFDDPEVNNAALEAVNKVKIAIGSVIADDDNIRADKEALIDVAKDAALASLRVAGLQARSSIRSRIRRGMDRFSKLIPESMDNDYIDSSTLTSDIISAALADLPDLTEEETAAFLNAFSVEFQNRIERLNESRSQRTKKIKITRRQLQELIKVQLK